MDNGFRNQFSYVDYRRWGVVEVWAAGRISGEPPKRQGPEDVIEVWFNWELAGRHKSYAAAEAQMAEILRESPVNLSDVLHYLDIRR